MEESFYWKPLTKVAESGCTYNYNQSLSSCIPTVFTQLGWFQAVPPSMWLTLKSTFPVPGPYSEERAWAQKPVQSPLPTYLGTDGVTIYNRAAWNMFSFSLLFFSLSLFPHWMMKPMCLKSDKVRLITRGKLCSLGCLYLACLASTRFLAVCTRDKSQRWIESVFEVGYRCIAFEYV